MPVDPEGRYSRLFITGRSGSGKSTLATLVGERTGLPIHDLDRMARVGGGRGPETSTSDRAAAVAAILDTKGWIAEGVQLTWTKPLLDAADAIVWLDHLGARESSRNVLRRFVAGAVAEARQRRGRERLLRVGDYARRLRELVLSLPDIRTFPGPESDELTATYADKLVRCRSTADIDRFVESLGARSVNAARGTQGPGRDRDNHLSRPG